MAKEKYVTRRVAGKKKYNVYKMEGLQLTLLDTIEVQGKVTEKELAEKHNVDKVILELIEEKTIKYVMTVDDFMKYAVELIEDSETETDNEENK